MHWNKKAKRLNDAVPVNRTKEQKTNNHGTKNSTFVESINKGGIVSREQLAPASYVYL